ncbi:integrase catalytic domain-containing protein [Trichonephila clavata]|uniref:Integrase catalytic domain-containing protein n=1 Tax=Trichonephila clavata TaxID=2740835 RepID=A0A8X6I3U3_TRICU|nr:integrase catalytic domain-containing protein [Trichonephila clavata]
MTHTRNEAGRYIVQMPTKDITGLGHSKGLAMKRLDQLWRRLSKDKQMEILYREQYLDLGHMEKVEEHLDETSANKFCYYLPHHGVFRPDKTTTKLRVVFNGLASTNSGLSLNDLLLKGEVKEDIFEIMTRFRKQKYAFTIDIQMMFRQILIDPAQRDLLRIMLKTGANDKPVIYRLKTVTYLTSSAPFLAIRTLKQLAMDEASRFPLASKVALQDVYMDDVVSGAQTLDTARQLQCQLQNMLKTCGMKLHKWNSNSKELFNSSTDQEHSFSTNTESAIKILGVSWKPTGDYFMFKVSIPSIASYTKRDVLSVIARLYDPLGLIGPVISKAKIFLQKLWLRKLNWEECLPEAIASDWLNFVSSLKALEELKIDRYLLTDSYEKLMLLGYADASESAYGAVVYMHCVKEDVSEQRTACYIKRIPSLPFADSCEKYLKLLAGIMAASY